MQMHRTNVELLDHLYGIAGSDEHLEGCADCRKQLADLREARQVIVANAQAALPVDFLANQRAQIWRRIEERSWHAALVKPLSAAAAAAVVIAGFILWTPSKPAPYPDEKLLADVADAVEPSMPRTFTSGPDQASANLAQSSSDAKLFEEIQSDLSVNEPRAAEPLRGLYTEAY
jgi:hypothetical protein